MTAYRGLWKDLWPEVKIIARTCRGEELRRVARAATRFFDSHLSPVGLRLPQLTLLAAVGDAGPEGIGIMALAERLDADRTTMSRNVAVLVRRKILERWKPRGHRSPVIRVTPLGADLLRQAIPLWQSAQDDVESGASEAAWKTTWSTLSTFVYLHTAVSDDDDPESG